MRVTQLSHLHLGYSILLNTLQLYTLPRAPAFFASQDTRSRSRNEADAAWYRDRDRDREASLFVFVIIIPTDEQQGRRNHVIFPPQPRYTNPNYNANTSVPAGMYSGVAYSTRCRYGMCFTSARSNPPRHCRLEITSTSSFHLAAKL